MQSSSRPRVPLALPSSTALLALLASCGGGSSSSQLSDATFSPLDPVADVLTSADVDAIVETAAESTDSSALAVAVVDRIGNVLRIWNRDPASALGDYDNKIAVALARTAALSSTSQSVLASRSLQFASTHHYPAQFDEQSFVVPFDVNSTVETWDVGGLVNTPAGPFWQFDTACRGAALATNATTPPFTYAPGKDIPRWTNPDGTVPSPGLTPTPGGLPLYKRTLAAIGAPGASSVERRLVGGIGVFARQGATQHPDAATNEFAAWRGAQALCPSTGEPFAADGVPAVGAIFLDGVLLPIAAQLVPPPLSGPGSYDVLDTVVDNGAGSADPDGDLVVPQASASIEPFSALEVDALLDAGESAALATHSGLRLPSKSACRVVLAVVDREGIVLGVRRMEDAAIGALDTAISKARTARLYSDPLVVDEDGALQGLHPLTGLVPAGTAVTTRTLWFLSQPFFPPGIDASAADHDMVAPFDAGSGPLYELAIENRKPFRFEQMGFAPAAPIDLDVQDDSQNGLCFVAGGMPVYRAGVLIGAIGVCGDGPAQCDLIASEAVESASIALAVDLAAPFAIRANQYSYQGVTLPYAKSPQHPDG
jgi:uncharacterized protein GlcG (DUF336 family)